MGSSPFFVPAEHGILVWSSCAFVIERFVIAHLSLPVHYGLLDFALHICD